MIGAVVLVIVVGLAGCSAPPDLSDTAAARLQEAVADVTVAAADGRYEEAIDQVARVRAELERAAEAGELSIDRYRRIDDALTRTETELAAILASAQEPAVEPQAAGGDSGTAAGGPGPEPRDAEAGGVGRVPGGGPDADDGPGSSETGRGERGGDGGQGVGRGRRGDG